MRLPVRPFALATLTSFLLAATPHSGDPHPLPGFTAASAAGEREWEERFKPLPSPDRP